MMKLQGHLMSRNTIIATFEGGEIVNADDALLPLYLKRTGDSFAILILPDHPTPVKLRTHTSDPVPYLIYRHGESINNKTLNTYKVTNYNEETASKTGIFISDGYKIIERLIEK